MRAPQPVLDALYRAFDLSWHNGWMTVEGMEAVLEAVDPEEARGFRRALMAGGFPATQFPIKRVLPRSRAASLQQAHAAAMQHLQNVLGPISPSIFLQPLPKTWGELRKDAR